MAGAYHTVAFSYANPNGPIEQSNPVAGFRPPFPVPESLLQHLVSKYVTSSYSQVSFPLTWLSLSMRCLYLTGIGQTCIRCVCYSEDYHV